MKLYCLIILTIFVTFALPSLSQSNRRIIIEGKIKNCKQPDSLSVTAKGLLLINLKETIKVDKNGRFRQEISAGNTPDLLMEYGNNSTVDLYTGDKSIISLEWDHDNFPGSLTVLDKDDHINRFLIAFQNKFQDTKETIQDTVNTMTSLAEVIKTIKENNETQFNFLRQNGHFLTPDEYLKCATDIFYNNLSSITSAPIFSSFNFSEYGLGGFPFIVLYTPYLDSLKNAIALRMQKANSTPALIERFSSAELTNTFTSGYTPLNTVALYQSSYYRDFLYSYTEDLLNNIRYRSLGVDFNQSIFKYDQLLKAMITNQSIVQWLVATKIQHKFFFGGADKFPVDDFNKTLELVDDPFLKASLTNYYTAFTKVKQGNKAPVITFLREDGKTDATTNYKGKYIFIDVWSSYCAPCISEITRYSEATFNRFKGKDIIFLYLSLDTDKKAWLTAVDKYKPRGINGLVAGGFNSQFAKDYTIFAVPRYLLISPEGNVVDSNFQGFTQLDEIMLPK